MINYFIFLFLLLLIKYRGAIDSINKPRLAGPPPLELHPPSVDSSEIITFSFEDVNTIGVGVGVGVYVAVGSGCGVGVLVGSGTGVAVGTAVDNGIGVAVGAGGIY
tara:strand:- start:92 stop:409 length:318 start_codon:yes stop_codon:yes gene_type:complete